MYVWQARQGGDRRRFAGFDNAYINTNHSYTCKYKSFIYMQIQLEFIHVRSYESGLRGQGAQAERVRGRRCFGGWYRVYYMTTNHLIAFEWMTDILSGGPQAFCRVVQCVLYENESFSYFRIHHWYTFSRPTGMLPSHWQTHNVWIRIYASCMYTQCVHACMYIVYMYTVCIMYTYSHHEHI